MATSQVTVTSNDFLNKPVKDIYSMGNVNLPVAPKTDIKAFNQSMVNAQPGQTNFNIPTVPTNTPPTNTMANTTPATSTPLSQYYDQPVSYLSEAMKYAQEKANTAIPTEEEARQNALKAMQAEIDATNTLYADKLRRAQQQGAGLIGQTGAIQARRGLLGSDFGTAQTQNVNTSNEEVYSSIENEKLVKINQIQTKAKQDATAAIAEKRAAKEAGLKEYVDYLSKEKTLKETAANATIQDMLANNIDLKDFSDSEIENLAKSYGLTGAKLKSTFAQAKKTITDAAAKTAAEQAKAGRVTLTEGQRVFQVDPKTGEYKQVAFNPKTYKATTGTSGGGSAFGSASTGGSYKNDIDYLAGIVRSTKNSATAPLFTNAYNSARSDSERLGIIAANTVLPAEIKNDLNKRIQAIGNLDAAIAEINNGAKTGYLRGLAEKGVNKFGDTTDPQLARINQAIVSATQPYRSSVTGAAWGTQEEAEYANLFGSALDNPEYLKQKLTNLKSLMMKSNVNTIAGAISPLNYEQTANTFNTGLGYTQPSAAEYDYERDLTAAQEAIAAGADKATVQERFNQKYSGNTQF